MRDTVFEPPSSKPPPLLLALARPLKRPPLYQRFPSSRSGPQGVLLGVLGDLRIIKMLPRGTQMHPQDIKMTNYSIRVGGMRRQPGKFQFYEAFLRVTSIVTAFLQGFFAGPHPRRQPGRDQGVLNKTVRTPLSKAS